MAGPSRNWPGFPSDYEGDAPKGEDKTREVIKLSFQLRNLPRIFNPGFQCLPARGRRIGTCWITSYYDTTCYEMDD